MRLTRPTLFRLLAVALVLIGFILALAMRGAMDPAGIERLVGTHPLAPFVYILMSIGATLVFVPRTALALAAGLIFGFWWGLFWATIGSLAGSVTGFLLARYVSAGWIDEDSLPKLAPLRRAVEKGGWRAVMLTRLVPFLPNTPVNYALALTRITLGGFTIGSFLGMLPTTLVFVQLGASGNYALTGGHWVLPSLIGLALLGVTMLLPRLPLVRRAFHLAE